jgi:hypothetical protein
MYTDAKYVIVPPSTQNTYISVLINGVQSGVPIDPANTDYAAITALVAAGKLTIAPAK